MEEKLCSVEKNSIRFVEQQGKITIIELFELLLMTGSVTFSPEIQPPTAPIPYLMQTTDFISLYMNKPKPEAHQRLTLEPLYPAAS